MKQTTTPHIPTHIALEGACNARHLGGYSTPDGVTRDYAFIRCEAPTDMTDADLVLLIKLGVRTVIDLRTPEELAEKPNPFAAIPTVALHHISIFPSLEAMDRFDWTERGESYRWVLENCKEAYYRVFQTILQAGSGVLFHCAAGKDRTGILAMLLLLLAGVEEDTVAEEYAYTQILLAPWVAQQSAMTPELSPEQQRQLHGADAPFIQTAIGHLERVYGGVEGYLTNLGLTDREILSLRRRMVKAAGEQARTLSA